MSDEFAEVPATETPETADVDVVEPDLAPDPEPGEAEASEPQYVTAFELRSRGLRDGFTPDEWDGMPESARAKVEALAKAASGVDESFRAVQGRYDKAQAELRELEIKRIEAETRAKTLAEVHAKPAPEPPRYSEPEITATMTKTSREIAAMGRQIAAEAAAGYDVTAKEAALAEKERVLTGLERMLESTRAYHEAQRKAAEESARPQMDRIGWHMDAIVKERDDAEYAAWAAQRNGIPKEVVAEVMAKVDDHLCASLGVRPIDLIRDPELLRRREDLIAFTMTERKKTGIAEPKTEPKGPGAPRAADPVRLPSSGRSAGRVPARRGEGAMSGVAWRGPRLFGRPE